MTSLAEALNIALLHFVWQGIALGVVWGLLRMVLRNRSANSRYVAGCMVLAALALAPVITFGFAWQSPVVAVKTFVENSGNLPTFGQSTVTEPLPEALWGNLESWILPLWAAGVSVFALRLAWAGGHASSLRRKGVKADSSMESMIAGLAERLGVRQKLRVLMSPVAEVPAVVGWLRPVILLPAAVVVGLTPEQLESLLAHELAHIRRHDYFVNIVQMLVETFLFYHPVVWWVSSSIRYERELCCDDLAVRSCGDAVSYARALAQLERLRSVAPSLVMGSANGPLFHRIQRLLGRGKYEQIPSRLACAAGLLAGFLCLGWFMTVRAQQREALAAGPEPTRVLQEVAPAPLPAPNRLPAASGAVAQPAPITPLAPLAPIPASPAAPAIAAPVGIAAAPMLAAPVGLTAAPTLVAPVGIAASPTLAAPVGLAVAPTLAMPVMPEMPAVPPKPAPARPLREMLQGLTLSPESHWVLFRGGSIIARATAAEEEQARKARVSFTGDVLWFQMDGKTFITQDKDVMDRLAAAATEQVQQIRLLERQLIQLRVQDAALDQSRAQLQASGAQLQASLEQVTRSLRNNAGENAAAGPQQNLEAMQAQLRQLQAVSAQMQAMNAMREAEVRARESELSATQRNAEQGALREGEILRGAVREGKAQIVP
jgi:beta-lactamase regulating signal transducer with metallopeptidase domain